MCVYYINIVKKRKKKPERKYIYCIYMLLFFIYINIFTPFLGTKIYISILYILTFTHALRWFIMYYTHSYKKKNEKKTSVTIIIIL